MAVLSSVWKSKYLSCHITDIYSGAVNTFPPSKNPRRLIQNKSVTTCIPSVKLVKKALTEAHVERPEVVIPMSSPNLYRNLLGLELDFLTEQAHDGTHFPSVVNVLIYELELLEQEREPFGLSSLASLSHRHAESRLRVALAGYFEGEESSHWASSSVLPLSPRHISCLTSLCKPIAASESRMPPKSKVQSIMDQQEELIKVGISESKFLLDTLAEEDGHMEFLPYQFDSSFLADMDEFGPISDFTDLG